MAGKDDSSDSDAPTVDHNVIRIQLRKSRQKKWELRTRNYSPGLRFPTIQLFDCEGNLLVETNDENISIKSTDFDDNCLRQTKSLHEKDYRHIINKNSIRKHNTISGGKIYTRIFKSPVIQSDNKNLNNSYIIRDSTSVTNIPSRLNVNNDFTNLQPNSLETSPFQSEGVSEVSSYKSSDNETCEDLTHASKTKEPLSADTIHDDPLSNSFNYSSVSSLNESNQSIDANIPTKENELGLPLHKSQSFNETTSRSVVKLHENEVIQRSSSSVLYNPPQNKVSFLNTYLKSLPARVSPKPNWFTLHRRLTIDSQYTRAEAKRLDSFKTNTENRRYSYSKEEIMSDNEFINIPTDVAADCEMKKRLKMYRRGLSEIETRQSVFTKTRRHSVSGMIRVVNTSSSESVDEADVVLNRLKRRILKNKLREKRRSFGAKFTSSK